MDHLSRAEFFKAHQIVQSLIDRRVMILNVELSPDNKRAYAFLSDGVDDWFHMALTEKNCKELSTVFSDLAKLFSAGQLVEYEEPAPSVEEDGRPPLHKYLLEVRTIHDEPIRFAATAPSAVSAVSIVTKRLKQEPNFLQKYVMSTLAVLRRLDDQ